MSEAATNRRKALPRAMAAAVLMLGVVTSARSADPWKEIAVLPQDMVGTLSCSAVSCHGGGGPRYWSASAAGSEYVHWLGGNGSYGEGRRHYDPRAQLEKTSGDPHALAGQRISSARFQEVLRRASQRADGSADAAMYQQCARCHDPGAVASKPEDISLQPPSPTSELVAHGMAAAGIGCETCHGGGRQWIAVHYQRDISRERLLELGMVDTKNLFVRARLCAGCHVGSVESDMNHDMIAAGHPPLRFEQASYEALIGSKHWDDRPQRKTEPGYEVQLWAAGRIAAAEAALAVLEGRARRAEAQGSDVEGQRLEYAPWPEFAEGNCFACHQPMRSVAGARSRSDGTLAWQSWNLAMLNSVVASGTAATTELPPAALAPSLNRLRMAMEGSFMPRPNQIAELAAAARTALRAVAKVDSHGRILDREGQPLQIRAAVERAPSVTSMQNWDELCQQTAALAAARRAIEDANNERQVEAEQRLLAVARLLRFQTADREWPAVFANITNESSQRRPVTLNEVIGALDQTRADLLRAAIQIDSHP